MNARMSNLHQHRLGSTVQGIGDDLVELKTGTQFTGGASIVYSTSSNPGAYDWSGVVPSGNDVQNFLITMTGAPGTVLYANSLVLMSLDGFASVYGGDDYLNELYAYNNHTSTNIPFSINVYTVPNTAGQGTNVNQNQVSLNGDPNRTLYLKVYAWSLQPVSITVTPL